jgi:hypothetical protein
VPGSFSNLLMCPAPVIRGGFAMLFFPHLSCSPVSLCPFFLPSLYLLLVSFVGKVVTPQQARLHPHCTHPHWWARRSSTSSTFPSFPFVMRMHASQSHGFALVVSGTSRTSQFPDRDSPWPFQLLRVRKCALLVARTRTSKRWADVTTPGR